MDEFGIFDPKTEICNWRAVQLRISAFGLEIRLRPISKFPTDEPDFGGSLGVMLIGLTGRNASGKGEVAKYLEKKSFYYHSLSDVIRDEIRRRGQPLTRETLIETGNELRQRYGSAVLAERILERIENDKHYVIDSIRNPK